LFKRGEMQAEHNSLPTDNATNAKDIIGEMRNKKLSFRNKVDCDKHVLEKAGERGKFNIIGQRQYCWQNNGGET